MVWFFRSYPQVQTYIVLNTQRTVVPITQKALKSVTTGLLPDNRKSHMKQQKRNLTPFSAPSDATFTVEDWKEGPDALNGYVSPECTAPDMTRPNEA